MEYDSPLKDLGVKSYNSPGLGEKLSNMLHISGAIVLPPNARTVVTSGQTGFKTDGSLTYPEDLVEEYTNAFQSVVDALAAAGVQDGFASVYQMTTYHAGGLTDAVDAALEKMTSQYFKGNRPAWAGVAVAGLYGGARIEITVSAILRD